MFLRSIDIKLTRQTAKLMRHYANHASAVGDFVTNTTYYKKQSNEELVMEALEHVKVDQLLDWGKVREYILGCSAKPQFRTLSLANVDAIIMSGISSSKRLDWARNYLRFLQEKDIKPNLATIGRYLHCIYDNCGGKINKEIEEEILNICKVLEKEHPILDARSLDHIVVALSLTKEWKKCLKHIEEIKRTSSVSLASYGAVIAAAFLNKEPSIAWQLLDEVVESERLPPSHAYLAYLQTLKRQRKRESIIKNLEILFSFLKSAEVPCQEDVVDDIINSFHMGVKTKVQFSGHCLNCKRQLDKFELTDEEFEDLKSVFFKNAILGKDVFIKTNPKELDQFQEFVQRLDKHDVVLDGLNIAYSAGTGQGPAVYSQMLAQVVSHFVSQSKSVLVLGRVHMTRWPKYNWEYVRKNASVFLTENISQDDPYLIYCALHCGKDTLVVTRDLMRSHKFLLKDRKYKALFDRWLSQRQYFLKTISNRKPHFQTPPNFSVVAQQNDNTWHIPYIPEGNTDVNESYHKTWLCLDKN